ncbi:MAG: ATP-binding cassette domain-containing protein, partial [Elioraea tepidiphila]
MGALVALSGLTVDFDTGKRVVRALHGVDLSVARGEAVGLVGESGSGKSVTWLAALGLLGGRARIGGSVQLDGTELVGAPVRVLEAMRGKRINWTALLKRIWRDGLGERGADSIIETMTSQEQLAAMLG